MTQSPRSHKHPLNDPLTPELRLTLASASQAHLTSQDELHDAVCHYMEHLRRRGFTRERAMHTVREFVGEMRGFNGPAPVNGKYVDRMPRQLDDWCTEYWPP